MLWGFFERLQKRIKSRCGKHVNFVDNVHFITRRGCTVIHTIDNLPDVVHARAGGGVHFEHIHMIAIRDSAARIAGSTGLDRGAAIPIFPYTIQALSNDPRGRCFSDTAHAGHDKRMGNPIRLEGIPERLDHGVLPDKISKGIWSVLAGKHLIIKVFYLVHRYLSYRGDSVTKSRGCAPRQQAAIGSYDKRNHGSRGDAFVLVPRGGIFCLGRADCEPH